MLVVRCKESGDVIERVATFEEGLQLISEYEKQDLEDGTFEENFYEVAEIEE